MALYMTSFDVAAAPEPAFDFLADFSNTRLWDPSVPQATRLDSGPIGLGSHFEVGVNFLGTTSSMTYEITRFDRPKILVLEATTPWLTSEDEIAFVETPRGLHVSYCARLTLAPLFRLGDPALQFLFEFSGDRSRDGLKEALANLGQYATSL